MNETLILALLLGLLGFINWALGYRLFRVLLTVGYFLVGAGIAGTVAQQTLATDERTIIVWGIALLGGLIGAVLSFALWSLWMIFAGGLLGLMLGYGISLSIGVEGLVLAFITVFAGLIGGLMGFAARKPLVVIATAFSGAGMMTYAVHLAFPELGLFDPEAEGITRLFGFLIVFAIGVIGVAWQASRTKSWLDSDNLVARQRDS